MCQRCSDAVEAAIKNGVSEDDAMAFLWNETPFPMGVPTEEQFLELSKLGKDSGETERASIKVADPSENQQVAEDLSAAGPAGREAVETTEGKAVQ